MNWRAIIGIVLLLIGAVSLGSALWREQVTLRTAVFGEPATATVTDVTAAGRSALAQGRFNPTGNPASVETFAVAFRFEVNGGNFEGCTVLDAYELDRRFERFTLTDPRAPIGERVAIRYLPSDPWVNAINRPLPFAGFWSIVLLGSAAVALGGAALFSARIRAAIEP